MSIDLGQAVDDFYQGRSAPPEVIKMIGVALLREQLSSNLRADWGGIAPIARTCQRVSNSR